MKNVTVIKGTLRKQDLIPAFTRALKYASPEEYADLTPPPAPFKSFDDLSDDSPWWDSDDAEAQLEELFDRLNLAAPQDYYFGAHPGDGSDFGFWEEEERYDADGYITYTDPGTDRVVTLSFTQDDYAQVETSTDAKALQAAIGYLATWAAGSSKYKHCTLLINASEPGVTAVYREEPEGPVTYCIGAVWHETHFGFHS